jgi:hypothetical protein
MIRPSLLAAALAIAAAPVPAGAAPAGRQARPAEPAESATDEEPADEPTDSAEAGEPPEDAGEADEADEADEVGEPDDADEVGEPDEPAAGAEAARTNEKPSAPADPDIPPEDVQSFADATLDATPLHFAFNAFGDVSVSGRSPSTGDDSATFALGTFALLINGQLSKSLLGTAEMAFEAGEDNEQDVTLERLHLRWQTPHFFLVGGRTHSDIGYWNTAFHHGAWLHLPIARPRALRGEDSGGILPIHWIGLEGGARATIGSGALTIAGGVGNGRGRDEQSIPLRRDTNNFKSVKVKIEYLGLGWPDLRVGVGGLYDPIAPESMDVRPALPDARIDETIANAYAAYRGGELTLIAEAYSIWHRAEVATFNTTDAFVVIGYRFGRLTPYLQLERTDERGGVDPFYTPVPGMPTPSTPIDQTELLLGARFDPSVWSALKVEYRHTRIDAADGADHSLAVNWSFGI